MASLVSHDAQVAIIRAGVPADLVTEYETSVRRDERRLLAVALAGAVGDQQHVELALTLRARPELRRTAGMLVHMLCSLLLPENAEEVPA